MKQKLLQEQEKLKKQLTKIQEYLTATEKKRLQELAGIYEEDIVEEGAGAKDVTDSIIKYQGSFWFDPEAYGMTRELGDDDDPELTGETVTFTHKGKQYTGVVTDEADEETGTHYRIELDEDLEEGMSGTEDTTLVAKSGKKGMEGEEGEEGEGKPKYASMNYRPGSRSFSTKRRTVRGARAAAYAPPHAGVHKPVKEGMIGKDPVEELLETISTELDFIQRFVDTNSNIPVNEKLEILKRVIGLQEMIYDAEELNMEGVEDNPHAEESTMLQEDQSESTPYKGTTKEGYEGTTKEGEVLVKRFLIGLAKKFNISEREAAWHTHDTIKKLGYLQENETQIEEGSNFIPSDYLWSEYGEEKAAEIEDRIMEDLGTNGWDMFTSLETPDEVDQFIQPFL